MPKNKAKDLVSKTFRAVTDGFYWIVERWRNASPGFRYALIYFMCVMVIAGLVWWQFRPPGALVFDPEGQGSENQKPLALEEGTPAGDDQQSEPNTSIEAFAQGLETFAVPLRGEILLRYGQVFSPYPYNYETVEGLHLGGVQGAPVYASFQGKVIKTVEPSSYESGEVWITHGDFETRYKNLGLLFVAVGDFVGAKQQIGELGAKLRGDYTEDYLVFEIMDAEQKPLNPLEYGLNQQDHLSEGRSNASPGDI